MTTDLFEVIFGLSGAVLETLGSANEGRAVVGRAALRPLALERATAGVDVPSPVVGQRVILASVSADR